VDSLYRNSDLPRRQSSEIINQFIIPGRVCLERFCCSIDRLEV
jgi:hypothetical protein